MVLVMPPAETVDEAGRVSAVIGQILGLGGRGSLLQDGNGLVLEGREVAEALG